MGRIEEALSKAARRTTSADKAAAPPVDKAPKALSRPEPITPDVVTDSRLVVIKQPNSPEAEEFRKLKEALIKTTKNLESGGNVILVTSAVPREGKSLVTLNLAVSLSQEFDHTVLVVDADIRKPSCHIPFGLAVSPGLSDHILDDIPLPQALARTNIDNLVILPAGRSIDASCEMFSSNTMRRLIQELKHRYPDRIILIDSPPILTFAETRILNSQADATILVVMERQCPKDGIQECVKLLGDKVIGVVYNKTAVRETHNYHHLYYTN